MLGRTILRCASQLSTLLNGSVCTRGISFKPIRNQYPSHLTSFKPISRQCVRGVTKFTKHNYGLPSDPFTCTQEELGAVALPLAIDPPGERYIGALLINVRCSSEAALNSYCMFAEYSAEQLGMLPSVTPGKITRSVMTVNRSPFKHGYHKDRFTRDLFNKHILLKDLSGSTADVYLEYLQRHMIEGMSMSVTEERLVEIDDTFLQTFYSSTNAEMGANAQWVNSINTAELNAE